MDDEEFGVGTWVALIAGAVLMVCVIGFGVHACSVADQATLGRLDEQVRRENFEQTKSYRDGLRRDFDELLLSYSRAKSDDERATIVGVMRHRAEGAPPELVPNQVKLILEANR